MTREIKLALILGFALVLTVGILIADHFSQAQQASLATITSAESEERTAPPFRRLISEGADIVRDAFDDDPPPVAAGLSTSADQRGADLLGGNDGRSDLSGGSGPGTIEMGASSERELRGQLQAGERVHVVRRGQTLWAIAEEYYGDGNEWRRILERNRGSIPRNGEVEVGSAIVIPVLSGGERAAPRPLSRASTYTVRAGDTLSGIAQSQLGAASRWRDILSLNSDRIQSPEQLYTGLELKLPRD